LVSAAKWLSKCSIDVAVTMDLETNMAFDRHHASAAAAREMVSTNFEV